MTHKDSLSREGAQVGGDVGGGVDDAGRRLSKDADTTPREAGDRVQDETKGIVGSLYSSLSTDATR